MKVFSDFDLTKYNSYRLSATCKTAYFPDSEEDIIDLFCSEFPDGYFLLGSGHNVILSKDYYEKPFVIFNGNFNRMEVDDRNVITAEAGTFMKDLSIFARDVSLSGLEMFYDIPSSLGGAVVMNAGASGMEIKDVLSKVRYYDIMSCEVVEKEARQLGLHYRTSDFQLGSKIILKAWFKLTSMPNTIVESKMIQIQKQRWEKQPKNFPNAGSVFKRPDGRYVGPMIEELGLKGFAIGDAQISEKHAGFIINRGQATASDILKLIEYIKLSVLKKFGVTLEVEQRIF